MSQPKVIQVSYVNVLCDRGNIILHILFKLILLQIIPTLVAAGSGLPLINALLCAIMDSFASLDYLFANFAKYLMSKEHFSSGNLMCQRHE